MRRKSNTRLLVWGGALLLMLGSSFSESHSQVPQLINFQAQIDGMSDGPASLIFTIYDAPLGGEGLWTETHPDVEVNGGAINLLLGSITAFDPGVFEAEGDRYLALTVNGETIEPRYRLSSVAYALRSDVADRLRAPVVSSINGLTDAIVFEAGDNIEIAGDGQTLTIHAVASPDTSQGGTPITITPGTGIDVTKTGSTTKVSIKEDSITDDLVKDNALTRNSLAKGAAVFSLNGLADDIVLQGGTNVDLVQNGQILTINAESGGEGISSINGGSGISVQNPKGPTPTVSIQNNSINDTHIQDNSISGGSLASGSVGSDELNSQITLGTDGRLQIQNASGQVRVDLTTVDGNGFLSLDTASDRDAVTLEALSGAFGMVTVHNTNGLPGTRAWGDLTGTGLYGASLAIFKRDGEKSSTWIRTEGNSATDAWGVIGVSDGGSNEVITLDGQNGDITIAGNLVKGMGSFKIDHPLDPEHKYLSHSFVESPDMMNIYNGNVVLDGSGEAWVELPEWFGALNGDFRYQLTCIGGFAQVYIAEEIADNRFRIAGGTPGLKVSWQVTGIRHDPYAEAHRIQVEEDKPEDKQGTYIHPDVYGSR